MTELRRIDIEDFKHLLNQEIDVHREIEHNLNQKSQHIINGKMDGLVETDTHLEKLLERARDLEKERLRMMVHMGKEGETLRTFITSLREGEDRIYLEKARAKLVETIGSIQEQSNKNRELLTQSIRFIEQSVNVIASLLAPEGASYSGQSGARKDSTVITDYRTQSTFTCDA